MTILEHQSSIVKPKDQKETVFTGRELECIYCLTQHVDVSEVAKKLDITEHSVHFHLTNIQEKLKNLEIEGGFSGSHLKT